MAGTTWTNEGRFRRAILRNFRASPRQFPWRDTTNPYEVLVGEVLLQRTRGENAVGVYRAFLGRWPDAETLSQATQSEVAAVIRPLGLTKRADLIVRLGRALVAADGVPLDPAALARLPGVGPYAAHSVPVFAAGQTLPVVDWVIARVLRRYFGLPSILRPNADHDLWSHAAEIARPGRARDLWLGTLDFAATICTPKPKCYRCPLNDSCSYNRGAVAA
jgi:A/G-specific adenine glycosylase